MADLECAPCPCETHVCGFAFFGSVKKCALAHVRTTLGKRFLQTMLPVQSYPLQNTSLSFQKWPVSNAFLFPSLANAGPGADLEGLSRFWIPQSSIRPNFRIGPWLPKNQLWVFVYVFDQDSFPYMRKTNVLNYLHFLLISHSFCLPPAFLLGP